MQNQNQINRLFKPVAVACAVVFALSVAELSLRFWAAITNRHTIADLWSFTPTDPPAIDMSCSQQAEQARLRDIVRPSIHRDLVYELRPRVRTCFRQATLETDEDGLRGPVLPPKSKSRGAQRILLLGDSQAFGWGVEWEETIGERLEELLATTVPDSEFEVLNAGVPGYNTFQQMAFLEHKGLALSPDCVLVLFVGNDLGLPHFLKKPEQPLRSKRSYLFAALNRISGSKRWFQFASSEMATFVSDIDLDRVPEAYHHMVGKDGYRQALHRLAELTKTAGIDAVNVADYEPLTELGIDSQSLIDFQAKLGIHHLALPWPLGAEYRLSQEDPHLNPMGQAAFARKLAEALRAKGLCGLPRT